MAPHNCSYTTNSNIWANRYTTNLCVTIPLTRLTDYFKTTKSRRQHENENSAKLNIGEQSKIGLFFFFRFLFFIYLFSLFVFRFSLFDFVIRFSLLVFHLLYPLFVFLFSFFFFFDIQNRAQYRILTFKLRSNILYLHSKSYFDIQTGAEYRILIFKILFWNSKSGRKSYFDIQNPVLTFELRLNIAFDIRNPILAFKTWPNTYFDIQNPISTFELGPNIEFWH